MRHLARLPCYPRTVHTQAAQAAWPVPPLAVTTACLPTLRRYANPRGSSSGSLSTAGLAGVVGRRGPDPAAAFTLLRAGGILLTQARHRKVETRTVQG